MANIQVIKTELTAKIILSKPTLNIFDIEDVFGNSR